MRLEAKWIEMFDEVFRMGGRVAQELLALDPAGVHGLVLACTSASFGRADGAWQAQFIAERLAPLEAGVGMAGMAGRLVPGLVSPAAPSFGAWTKPVTSPTSSNRRPSTPPPCPSCNGTSRPIEETAHAHRRQCAATDAAAA